MKLLVTGARGMLGQAVARVGAAEGLEIVALGHDELDVRDTDAVRARLTDERPDVVVHCAAYTDVDGAEDDLRGAMDLNAEAARTVAEAAAEAGAMLVYPSSDYVFDGRKGAPYVESDPTRPVSIYGQSKLAGEHEVAKANPRHAIVRSSWLFGAGGRNFVDTMLGLAADHGEVAVVTDQVGCPTYTDHLAAGLLELARREALGVHHLAAAGECSWHDFALAVFAQAGVRCVVRERLSAEVDRPAPRPPYSVLVSERPDATELPPWTDGLADYLAARAVHA